MYNLFFLFNILYIIYIFLCFNRARTHAYMYMCATTERSEMRACSLHFAPAGYYRFNCLQKSFADIS